MDLDYLSNRPDIQLYVGLGRFANQSLHLIDDLLLEARGFDLEAVIGRSNQIKDITAGVRGFRCADRVCLHIGQGYIRVRHDSPLRIGDSSPNCRSAGLAP